MSVVAAARSFIERRRFVRRTPAVSEALRRVRSRLGRDLDVVDVSDAGMLIEGQPRLLPNTHIDIHIITRHGRVLVRCRVLRASVWYLEADLVRYRAALAFDRPIDTSAGYPIPGPFARVLTAAGTAYPEPGARADGGTGDLDSG